MIRKTLSSLYLRNRRALPYIIFSSIVIYLYLNWRDDFHEDVMIKIHSASNKWFISNRKTLNTSSFLGTHLYKKENLTGERNKTFSILLWRSWQHLQGWQLNRNQGYNLLENCSVKNCIFTANDDKLPFVDAVVVNLQRGDIPKVYHRNPSQRWIFANDNSPNYVFSLAGKPPNLKELANVFNWSMTYRSDADIPVPYGRTIMLQKPAMKKFNIKALEHIVPYWDTKIRDVLVAIYISNCNFKLRLNFVSIMQNFIPVDVFGECSANEKNRQRCPGYLSSDCEPISKYLFYIAFENSRCQEYLTEKIWYYAYMKGAIPIIVGPSFADCKRFLPPNSYIYVPYPVTVPLVQEIAYYIDDLSKNAMSLLSLHQWRINFKTLYEHGLFGTESYHLCRVCQALNYNEDVPKIYSEEDLRKFLDPNITCDNRSVL